MSLARIALALIAGIVISACARNPEPRASAESASTAAADSGAGDEGGAKRDSLAEVQGRVVTGGTDRFPVTSLVDADGSATRLVGALLGELRSLSGAELAARGVMSAGGVGSSLDVREYEVLSIDGQRPHVGVVIARDGELWLASRDTLRLVPALAALGDRVGARIWVVGASDSVRRELKIQSYGVIAPAP